MAVLFTGRLDETDALRAALGLAGVGDPAALVREAYHTWGPHEFAAHLCGDFAIVLWDAAARRLILARSPSGLYPLFHARRGVKLHFADSPQALLADHGGVAPDEQALAEWLVVRPRLSDRTLFEGIRRVSPGTAVIFEHGRLAVSRYWRPEALDMLHLPDHRDYADALRETLQSAVADRLRENQGDVAAQLSGGLDSSSVTALAAEQLAPSGRTVFAFTATPGPLEQSPVDGRFFDESRHAAAVAARYGNIVHRCVTPEKTPLFDILDRYADVEAVPPFNPHHLQWIDRTYAAASATGATTLLTGSMGNMTISASGGWAIVDALRHGRFARGARLFAASHAYDMRALRHVPGLLLTAFAPRLLDATDRLRRRRLNMEEFTGLRPSFARAHGIDLPRWNRRLAFRTVREDTLAAIDRFDLGMFHEAPRRLYGIEATDPTFDRRVVELALRIPIEQFCAGGVPRALIRTAMEGRLPDIVRLERRRGLQSADFLTMLDRERAAIAEELDRMSRIDLVRRAIDVPLLQQRLQWSARQAIGYGWHQYSNRLMRAVSAGRFIRRMMDGTLFSTASAMPPAGPDVVRIQL